MRNIYTRAALGVLTGAALSTAALSGTASADPVAATYPTCISGPTTFSVLVPCATGSTVLDEVVALGVQIPLGSVVLADQLPGGCHLGSATTNGMPCTPSGSAAIPAALGGISVY
ncbi:hypothetical protein [Nocardia stercoris]|uniref:Intersectin-EH binding protein Ibp1 n=1 Tax=Nocardia stercoris TaxID=2483361 RepID=A0A3M2LCH4_9NOCA|nr:hypothetical protein [Nocardia stercoris]RMI35237.1 hypothetical protein EBN03_02810 [Nocardia stercoris]